MAAQVVYVISIFQGQTARFQDAPSIVHSMVYVWAEIALVSMDGGGIHAIQ